MAGYSVLGREENLLAWGHPFQNKVPVKSSPANVSLQLLRFLLLTPKKRKKKIVRSVSSPRGGHKRSVSQAPFHSTYSSVHQLIHSLIL